MHDRSPQVAVWGFEPQRLRLGLIVSRLHARYPPLRIRQRHATSVALHRHARDIDSVASIPTPRLRLQLFQGATSLRRRTPPPVPPLRWRFTCAGSAPRPAPPSLPSCKDDTLLLEDMRIYGTGNGTPLISQNLAQYSRSSHTDAPSPTLAPMTTQTIGDFLFGSSLAEFTRLKKAETSAVSRGLAEIFVKGLECLWASHQDSAPYPLLVTGRCNSRYCHAQLLCSIEPPGAPYTILLRFASPLKCSDPSRVPLSGLSVAELVFCGVSWRDAPGVLFNTAALPLVLDALRPFRSSLQRLTFEHCTFEGAQQLAGLADTVRQLPSLHTLALRHCTGLLSSTHSHSLESSLTHPEVWNRLTAVDLEGSCFALALAVSLGVCARSAYYLDSRQSQLQRLSLTLFEPDDVYALLPHLRYFPRLTTLELFFKCGYRGLLRMCSRTESDFPQVFRCLEPPIETTKQVWIHWVDASPLAQYVGPTQYQWAMGVILWRWARVWLPPAFNTVPHAVGVNVSI